jgi:hypothetical protein
VTITIKRPYAITIIALLAAIATALIISACGNKFSQPFKDSPRSGVVNDQPADIIYMPDGFNNYATKCDHGFRIWVSYHQDSPYAAVAVAPDKACGKVS